MPKPVTPLERPPKTRIKETAIKDYKAISIQNYHLVNGTHPMRL